MELQQLRYLVAVAEAGSASRAASRCAVAQPSLSQQIMKLERTLGKRLFDRVGRGMVLTEAGRSFLPRARRILAEVREAEAWSGRDGADHATSLAIGAIPTIAPYLLPGALAGARKSVPACEFTIREDLTGALAEALIDHELDCALMSTPPDDDRLETVTIGEEELLAVVPSAWTSVPQGVVALTQLRDQPAVLLDEVHCLGQQVQAFCTSRKLGARVVCRTTQLATILEMVSLGLGFSLVPEMAAAADHFPPPGRRYVHIAPARPRRPIVLAWRVGRTRSRASQILLESLRACYQSRQRADRLWKNNLR
jgi:LysR family hydrogen peroxide-inducible transcriptional activator